MNNKQFEQVINRQFNNCRDLLVTKGKEYTPDRDVFEVFNKAATLSGEGGRKAALFNFMLKHLVSISDMCHSNETYSTDRWNEKITDAMNYLLLLKAMIEEDEIFRNDPKWGERHGKAVHGFKWVPDKPSYASWDEMAKAVEESERDTCAKNCEECNYYKDWKLGNTPFKDIEGPYCFFEISDEDIQKAKDLRNDPIWKATGYSSEEFIKKLVNTEIRLDQVFKKCSYDCNDCLDANCDGSDESFIDCKNNCNGCIHLSCGRRADNDEFLEETTAEDWEEFWKDVAVEGGGVKNYDHSLYRCDLDFPYCILGGPDKCSTCKHWVRKESDFSIKDEVARAKALEDDLK